MHEQTNASSGLSASADLETPLHTERRKHIILGRDVCPREAFLKGSHAGHARRKDQQGGEQRAHLYLKQEVEYAILACHSPRKTCDFPTVAALLGRWLIAYPSAAADVSVTWGASAEALRERAVQNGLESLLASAAENVKRTSEDVRETLRLACATEVARFVRSGLEEGEGARIWAESDQMRQMLQAYVVLAPLDTLTTWIAFQWEATQRGQCNREHQLFEFLSPFFLQRLAIDTIQPVAGTYGVGTHVWSTLFDKLSDFVGGDAREYTEEKELPRQWTLLPHHQFSGTGPAYYAKVNSSILRANVAQALNNHAVCLLQNQKKDKSGKDDRRTAVLALLSAYSIDQTPERLTNLGLAMQSLDLAAGFVVASQGAAQQHAERHRAYARNNGYLPPSPHNTNISDGNGKKLLKKRAAIYCFEYGNAYWGKWGPSSLAPGGGGLGGSEEAALYLAEELASRTHAGEYLTCYRYMGAGEEVLGLRRSSMLLLSTLYRHTHIDPYISP